MKQQKIKWLFCVDTLTADWITQHSNKEPLYLFRQEQKQIVFIEQAQQNLENILAYIDDVIKDNFYPCVVLLNRELHQKLLFELAEIKKFGYLFWPEKTVDILLALSYPDDDIISSWINVLESQKENTVTDINPPKIDVKFLETLQQWGSTHLRLAKTGPYAYVQKLLEDRKFSRKEFRFSADKNFLVHKDCPWLCWNIAERKPLGLLALSNNILLNMEKTYHYPCKLKDDDGLLAAATDDQPASYAIFFEITDDNDFSSTITVDFPNLDYYKDDSDDMDLVVKISLPKGHFSSLKNTQLSLVTDDGIVFFDRLILEKDVKSDDEQEDYIEFRCAPSNIEEIVQKIEHHQIQLCLD